MTISMENKQKIYDYLDTPEEERSYIFDLLRELHIKRKTFVKVQVDWEVEKRERNKREMQRVFATQTMGEAIESGEVKRYSREVQDVLDALHHMATKKYNAFAAKTFLQAKGELVEKSEVKVGLSADEIARRNLEADRQLRESGYRVDEVSKKSSLLHDPLRSDSGQSKTGDS